MSFTDKTLVALRFGDQRFFLLQEIGEGTFRADVAGFKLIERPLRFDGRGDGHEAEETAGVVAAVLVPGALIEVFLHTLNLLMLAWARDSTACFASRPAVM